MFPFGRMVLESHSSGLSPYMSSMSIGFTLLQLLFTSMSTSGAFLPNRCAFVESKSRLGILLTNVWSLEHPLNISVADVRFGMSQMNVLRELCPLNIRLPLVMVLVPLVMLSSHERTGTPIPSKCIALLFRLIDVTSLLSRVKFSLNGFSSVPFPCSSVVFLLDILKLAISICF